MLSAITGHKDLKEQIIKLSSSASTAHAFLFTGPKAVGKRLLAHAFAELLFKNQSEGNLEEIAKLFSNGTHPDFHLLKLEQGKRDIPVESVRALCSKLQLKPYYKGPAIAVIDQAHRLSIAGCNAFLKTLEEPPGHSYIFLITDSPQRLPETIVSRCQVINSGPLEKVEVSKVLTTLTAGDQKLAEKLANFSSESLELFDLDSFIDPVTLEVLDQKELSSYLAEFEGKLAAFAKAIDKVLDEEEPNTRSAKAAVAISEITQDKSDVGLVINVLKQRIRSKIRNSKNSKRIDDFSSLLLKTIEKEQLIHQRSLNPQVQLSALFC